MKDLTIVIPSYARPQLHREPPKLRLRVGTTRPFSPSSSRYPVDDLEHRATIVRALRSHATQPCATLLFGELRRVKSSNTTRKYLDEVIDALRRFPGEIIEGGFDDLASDTSFTPRMREKFRRAAGQVIDRRGDDEDDGW